MADLATFGRVLEALRYEASHCVSDYADGDSPALRLAWQRIESALASAVLAAEQVDQCSRCGELGEIATCPTCRDHRLCDGCRRDHDRSHEWQRGLARYPEAGNTPSMKLD